MLLLGWGLGLGWGCRLGAKAAEGCPLGAAISELVL
jgi:hypothetical protein